MKQLICVQAKQLIKGLETDVNPRLSNSKDCTRAAIKKKKKTLKEKSKPVYNLNQKRKRKATLTLNFAS